LNLIGRRHVLVVGVLGQSLTEGVPSMRTTSRLVGACVSFLIAGVIYAPAATAADTQPPTSPSNVQVLAVGPSTVTISFRGSTDDVGLKWYVVRVGNREQATTSPSSTQVGGLMSNTNYSLTVVAVDKVGNVSGPSEPVTFTTATWPSPTGLRVTSTNGGSVSLAWNRPANMDPYRYLIYDSGLPEVAAKTETVTMQRLAGGIHTFTVKAMHSNQDVSPASASVTVTVPPRGDDSTAPSAPGNPTFFTDESDVDLTTWTASTDETDPASSLTYDMLQVWAGDLFAVRYGVTGTQTSGFFVAAVRAVDPAGNRSEPAFTTVVW
jgi:hypothetical protein